MDTDLVFSPAIRRNTAESVHETELPTKTTTRNLFPPHTGFVDEIHNLKHKSDLLERNVVTRHQPNWKKIRREHTLARQKQLEGIESTEIFKLTIESKLREAGCHETWFKNFLKCGREKFYLMCPCGEGQEASYQCSQKICPRCNWRIADTRRKELEEITRGMTGVKHLVLTQKNFPTLTRSKIQQSRKNLLALRRQKIFGKVFGGCASLEFTNEDAGWHMHWHILIHAKFIPIHKIAEAWAKLVGQEFAICKIKDVTEGSYLQEVCKYAAKGSEIAGWKPNQILEFAEALRGTRLFTVFGTFARVRKFAKENLRAKKVPRICACGCTSKIFATDRSHAMRILESGKW